MGFGTDSLELNQRVGNIFPGIEPDKRREEKFRPRKELKRS